MRIRGYDEETEEYIGGVEQLSGDIADLTKTAKNPEGVSLFKDKDKTEFKSTTELLRDISKIYDDLTDKQQAALLEKLAGKRQGQIVAAMLNNFDTVESSLESMKNSVGSAMREMSIVSESLEFKLNALKETGVGIAQNIFNKEDLGVAIDGLTGFLSVLDQITEKIGLFGTVGAGLGIFAVLKNLKGIANFAGLLKGVKSLGDLAAAGSLAFDGLAGAIGVTAGVLGGFLGVAAGIVAAVAIVDALTTSFKELKKQSDQSWGDYQETTNNLKSLNDELETTKARIEELQGKDKLSVTEQQELSKLETQNRLLENQIKYQEKLQEVQAKAAHDDAKNVLFQQDDFNGTNAIERYNSQQNQYAKLEQRQQEVQQRLSTYSEEDMNPNAKWWNRTEGQKAYQADVKEAGQIEKQMSDLTSEMSEGAATLSEYYSRFAEGAYDENGLIKEEDIDYMRAYADATMYSGTQTEQMMQKQTALNEILAQDTYSEPIEKLQGFLEKNQDAALTEDLLREKLDAFGGEGTFDKLNTTLAESGISMEEFQYKISDVGDEIADLHFDNVLDQNDFGHFEGLAEGAKKASEELMKVGKLREEYSKIGTGLQFDGSDTDVSSLQYAINQASEIKARPDVDVSDIENANRVIAYCTQQLQELNKPAIMNVDASKLDGAEGELVTLLQQFQTVQNQKEIQIAVGADTSDSDAKLANLTSQIQDKTAKVGVDIDVHNQDAIKNAIGNNSFSVLVTPDVKPIPKQSGSGEVIYKNKITKLPKQTASGEVNWSNNYSKPSISDINKTIWWTNKQTNSKPSGDGGANGTAHAYGTAFAGGNWGAGHGGRALVGELGISYAPLYGDVKR